MILYIDLVAAALCSLLHFALHVTGSGSFPKPLTAKEERECLERIRSGDLAAKNILIEHNLRLVAHIVKKYYAASGEQALASAIDGALEHLAQNAVYMPVYVENSYFICQNDISGIVRGNSETLIYFAGATRS